ncbi:hypothetical protein BDV95DRAFT_144986 [Massariosphaeria phaeospora]|uniref:Uncharacterized protein n=1 Tax=Massariosphaeria phaeospora TaxID=100035 RepID=A0A7C8IIG1_9PLEO|nr:hypothetical protein BDV95DRAFT_144986 [Massariosphaeria phaeospora]
MSGPLLLSHLSSPFITSFASRTTATSHDRNNSLVLSAFSTIFTCKNSRIRATTHIYLVSMKQSNKPEHEVECSTSKVGQDGLAGVATHPHTFCNPARATTGSCTAAPTTPGNVPRSWSAHLVLIPRGIAYTGM